MFRSTHAVDLFAITLEWTARWFDRDAAAVWNPAGSFGEPASARSFHLTPNTAWFAYGALMSGRTELRADGLAALHRLLALQYDAPGEAWDGSFPRFIEAPEPGPGAQMWEDYDPNWRQFVGLTFAVVLEDLGSELDPSLVSALEDAVRRCVVGEPDGRIDAGYTNPALMRSWLDAWYGRRVGDDDLVDRGTRFAAEVVDLFDRHGAFDEFNSPTYYGIDLLALRCWQELAPTSWFAEQGARLEAEVWASAASFFNPALGTFAGPFTRAYTPDARRAVTVMSLWVWADAGRDLAPLPDLDAASVDHGHDLMAGPLIARLYAPAARGSRFVVPDEPDRRVELTLAGGRHVATEIQPTCSIGLESSPADWGGWSQFMPLVVQWLDGAGDGDGDGVGEDAEDEVQVCWLGRPGIVTGELLVMPIGDRATRAVEAVVELDGRPDTPVDFELLTYAAVEFGDPGAVRIGRRARMTATMGGRPVALSTEPGPRGIRRVLVTQGIGRIRLAFTIDSSDMDSSDTRVPI